MTVVINAIVSGADRSTDGDQPLDALWLVEIDEQQWEKIRAVLLDSRHRVSWSYTKPAEYSVRRT